MTQQTSRIAAGRRRAETAKQALAAGAVAAFVAALLLARAGHAAQPAESPTSTSQPAATTDDDYGFDLGGGSVAQAPQTYSQPQAQTGLS